MMLHRHFEALREQAKPKEGMDVKEGEDMLVTAEAEQQQAEPVKRGRKRKAE